MINNFWALQERNIDEIVIGILSLGWSRTA